MNRRTKKVISATTRQFGYDGANLAQERDSANAITANLITGLNIDELLRRTERTTTRDYITDALGSAVALTDSAGVVQTSYTYEPYGKSTTTGTANSNSFQFTGRENDGASGLYFYRNRYYHPTYGRFISADPIGFGGGDENLYRYVKNGPTRFTDPSGLIWANVGVGIIGGFVNAASTSYYSGSLGQAFVNGFVGSFVGSFAGPISGGAIAGGITSSLNSATGVTPSATGNPVTDAVPGAIGGAIVGRVVPGDYSGAAFGGWGEVLSNLIGGVLFPDAQSAECR